MNSTANDDSWDWVMSPRAEDQFSKLDSDLQSRIIAKLDDVVSSQWGEPRDFSNHSPVPRSTNYESEAIVLAVGSFRTSAFFG